MYAQSGQQLLEGTDGLHEVKLDGYRCLAGKDSMGVTLWSRRGNLFTARFPQIARACEHLPADTLLDGELVALDQNGRISFNCHQNHRSAAQALLFYAFDVLIYRGRNSMKTPLEDRREVLNEVFAGGSKIAAPVCLSETIDASPTELIRVVKEFRFRGHRL
jgi:bifunctional non-homologous end joining protein LigD